MKSLWSSKFSNHCFTYILVTALTLPSAIHPSLAQSKDQKNLAERYRKQGIKLYEENKFKEAYKQVSYAHKLAPKNVNIINSLGIVYLGLKKQMLAISSFHKAINLDPNYHKAWLNLINSYSRIGRYNKAIEVAQHAKVRFKNVPDVYNKVILFEKNSQAYIKLKKQGKPDKSQPYYGWQALAEKYINQGDFASAERILKEGLTKYPDSQPLAIELALNHERLERFHDAADAWKVAEENDPKNPMFPLLLMSAQTRAGDLQGVQAERKRFAQKFPKHKLAGTMTKMHRHYELKDRLLDQMEKKYGTRDLIAPYVGRYPILVYVHKRHINKTVWNANKSGPIGESDYIELIDQAFHDWVKASNGNLKFKFVKSPDYANIECAWTADRRKLHLNFAAGVTRYGYNKYRRPKSTIYLLLQKSKFDKREFYHTCLHEIGHALGLSHSKHPEDIMYFSTGSGVSQRGGLPRLSKNDVGRLNKLYQARWE